VDLKTVNQGIYRLTGVAFGFCGQMGVSRSGQYADMA
jgi:hypothetical protein